MYNDLLTIGPVTIHGYGLMIGIGVAAALLMGDLRAKKKGLDRYAIYGLTIVTVILGFLAARILFIITEWNDFLQNPMKYITGSGFVVFGGIIGGILTIWGYCKIKKMDTVAYMDLMVPSVAVAQGFGRIGCFLAGCCYGRETNSCIGITFHNSHFAPNNVKLLPSQIFMSLGDFIIAAILLLYSRKNPQKGKTGILYLILYSGGRFLVEFTRNDDRGFVGSLSTSQFIGIIVFVISLGLFFLLPWRKMENSNTREEINAETQTE